MGGVLAVRSEERFMELAGMIELHSEESMVGWTVYLCWNIDCAIWDMEVANDQDEAGGHDCCVFD